IVVLVRVRFSKRNECRDLAVLCAANPQTSFETRIQRGIRLRIGDVDYVILVDVDAAWPSELLPLVKKTSVLIEDLHTAVRAVRHKDPPAGIHRDAVWRVHFAGTRSLLAPSLDEFAILREFHDAAVAIRHMSIADEDVSIGRDHNVRGSVEYIRTFAGDAGLAKRHQDFALRTKLENLMPFSIFSLSIRYPDVSFAIYRHAVRLHEHVFAETLDQLACGIEFENRRFASMKNPKIPSRINVSRDHCSPCNARRKLRPAFRHSIRIVLRSGVHSENRNDRDQWHDAPE